MGLPDIKERRVSRRRKLTGLLPGRLVNSATQVDLSACKPVDISRNGMGIIVAEQLDLGTKVALILAETQIEFQIAWSRPDFGKQDKFRYGLVTLDQKVDLEQIFIDANCLK